MNKENQKQNPLSDEKDNYPCTDCDECLTDGDRCVNEDTCEKWKIYINDDLEIKKEE